jgi:hypothetical protein
MLSLVYHSPAAVSSTLLYATVVAGAVVAGFVYAGPSLRELHRRQPFVSSVALAVLLAAILAVSSMDALIVWSCSDEWIHAQCGADQWCIDRNRLWCWLLGVLY